MTTFRVDTKLNFLDDESIGAYSINTFHFAGGEVLTDPLDLANLARGGLVSFFTGTDNTPGEPLSWHLSPRLSDVMEVSFRVLSEVSGGPEFTTDAVSLDPITLDLGPTSLQMPNQVALCMSETCDPYGGFKRQSFYNRQYIGPINTRGLAANGRPELAMRQVWVGAAIQMAETLDEDGFDSVKWVVWSRKHRQGAEVTNGFCDNVYDTQRRRALEVTARTSLS